MTDLELKELVASLAIAQRETDLQIKELSIQQKGTDLQIKELGKQIGGIGNKFGSFTEGLAFPAMEKILRKHFKLETIATRVKREMKNRSLEIDVLAYNNGERNEVFVVEVKSRLEQRELNQIMNTMTLFPEFFPEHSDKKLYGMVAVVDTTKEIRQRVLDEGLYFARIHEEQFQLDVPQHFQARCFSY